MISLISLEFKTGDLVPELNLFFEITTLASSQQLLFINISSVFLPPSIIID